MPALLLPWLLTYILLWTLAGVCLDPSVPYDAVEALNWAMNGEWGSPKNPWLVGLAMQPALYLPVGLTSLWWYLSHFVGVAIGMAGVWFLARRLGGDRRLAWLALLTLNLSGILNFDIISFNDNYLLVMLWPWMWLCFLRAAFDDARWWLGFALVAGLGCMAKYSTLGFVGAVFILSLGMPRIRRCYRQPVFYLALLLWSALVVPNIFWLIAHDFAAFKWVDSQITPRLNAHTLLAASTVFYPLVIMAVLLRRAGARFRWPDSEQARAALLMYLIPLGLILLWFSFHDGGRITEWLQPYMMPASALMLATLEVKPARRLRRTFSALALCALLVWGGYCAVMLGNVRDAGQKFSDIQRFTAQVEQHWHQRYHRPLRVVGGDYLAQWVMFYAIDRPLIMTRWSNHRRPNIYSRHLSTEHVLQQGAAIVGPRGRHCDGLDYSSLLADWPGVAVSARQELLFSPHPGATPLAVCIGFVEPGVAAVPAGSGPEEVYIGQRLTPTDG